MSSHFVSGCRVTHPDHGQGTVLQVLPRQRVKVRFDQTPELPRTIWIRKLQNGKTTDAGNPAPAQTTMAKVSTASLDPQACAYQAVMEALRLGVVPANHVEDYTVSRKRELADIDKLLANGKGMRLIWGDYGCGKTHMLDLAEHRALAKGFIVGRLTLDPHEIPASHPQRLFSTFIRSLRYPNSLEQGWKPLFRLLVKSHEHLSPAGKSFSRYLSPVLKLLASGDDEAIGWASDYIEGYPMDLDILQSAFRAGGWQETRVLALSDYRTFGRVYTHLLGAIACWARDAGFKGLVLLMDEMEYLDFLPKTVLNLASEVLKHFAAATMPTERLQFDQNDLYRGGHRIHRELNIRFREDQPLSALMTLTPLQETSLLAQQVIASGDPVHLVLSNMDKDALVSLLDKIWDLYHLAYPDFTPTELLIKVKQWIQEEQLNSLDGISPREAVRDAVLMFDSLRWGQDPFPRNQPSVWDDDDPGAITNDQDKDDSIPDWLLLN